MCMSAKKTPGEHDRQDQIVAEARRYQAQREQTYRAQALKLYPWICTRCGRELSGTKLRELTVHHKDHNHDHSPLTGGTGSCCVSTVMKMSTPGSRWRTCMERRYRARTASPGQPTDRL